MIRTLHASVVGTHERLRLQPCSLAVLMRYLDVRACSIVLSRYARLRVYLSRYNQLLALHCEIPQAQLIARPGS